MLPNHGVKWADVLERGLLYNIVMWNGDDTETFTNIIYIEATQEGKLLIFETDDDERYTVLIPNALILGAAEPGGKF